MTLKSFQNLLPLIDAFVRTLHNHILHRAGARNIYSQSLCVKTADFVFIFIFNNKVIKINIVID